MIQYSAVWFYDEFQVKFENQIDQVFDNVMDKSNALKNIQAKSNNFRTGGGYGEGCGSQ